MTDGAPTLPTIRSGGAGLLLSVRVSPSAPGTAVKGLYGERLKVSVRAPAEDNRANEELVEALSTWLGLRRETVRVQSGRRCRDKVIAIAGVEECDLRSRLTRLLKRQG